jgi:uncharacterized protein (DUF1330 family)
MVTDPDSMAAYLATVGPTLRDRAVEVLVSTNTAETVEGDAAGPRLVVMRFADREAFHDWYDSPEYRAVIGNRLAGTEGFAVLADGRETR